MKKIFLFIITLFVVVQVNAQFFNSIGLTAGLSLGNQKFFFNDPSSIARKKYILGYNASFFGEFFSDTHFRWVSEIQYNQKVASYMAEFYLRIHPEENPKIHQLLQQVL